MAATTHSIEVNASLREVYNQWTQFEEFPRFMEGIEQVRQEGEKRRAEIYEEPAGVLVRFESPHPLRVHPQAQFMAQSD